MRNTKELFTVKRAAIAIGVVVAVVAPSMALHSLTAKGSSTDLAVGLVPAGARAPTTATSTSVPSLGVATGAGSSDPFGSTAATTTATAAPATAPAPAPATTVAPVAPVTTAPRPVVTTIPPPPSGPGSPSSYAFATYTSANVDKSPIRWSSSPSASVHYLVNLANAPAGAAADLTQAIAMIKAATGLNFVNDGSTNASTDNAACTPATLTTCWINNGPHTGTAGYPPVLIGWSPASAPIMAGGTLGQTIVGWQQTPTFPGDFELVSGVVAFNSTANLPGGYGGSSRGVVMLHELGLLVGLTSVNDPDQMMYPTLDGHVAAYGAGDLAGLKLAGKGVPYDVKPRP